MLQELLDKYTNNFPIVFDIKNISAQKVRVPLFDAPWAEDHGQVAITTTIRDIKYKDLCFQIASNITKFGLVTFELLSGDPVKFKQELLGETIYDSGGTAGDTPTIIKIPVTPVPVLATEDKFRYFDIEFIVWKRTRYEIDIPGGCTIRLSLYPVDMTTAEKDEIVQELLRYEKKEDGAVTAPTAEPGQSTNSIQLIPCDPDTFGIISIIAEGLSVPFGKALVVLTEIGILNMLHYPSSAGVSGSRVADALLKKDEWKPILEKIKAVWSA